MLLCSGRKYLDALCVYLWATIPVLISVLTCMLLCSGRKYLDALCVYLWATTPVLISVLTFVTFVLLGNTLTAAKATILSCPSGAELIWL